jgi:hypothetical protein
MSAAAVGDFGMEAIRGGNTADRLGGTTFVGTDPGNPYPAAYAFYGTATNPQALT